MGSISAFYIKTNGSWPVETYSVAPCAVYLNPLAGFLPAENLYRYVNSPLNETNELNTVYYNFTDYTFIEEDSQYAVNTTVNSNIIWDLSATRKVYDIGPQFNYFYVCATPRVDPAYRKYYSYLLYPSRLFLKPLSLVKNSNSWTLNTSAAVTKPQFFFFDSNGVNDGSTDVHENYVRTTPSFYDLNDSNISLVFNLSACRSWVKYPFIYFTSEFQNVINTSNFIDNKGGLIRPDSTFITYNINYRDNLGNVVSLGQDLPEETPDNTSNFKTSYILNHQNLFKKEQIYQLLQERPLGNETNLSSSANCVLSAVINLSSSYVTYNSQYKVGNSFTRYPTITGTLNSLLGINYTLDSSYFLNTSDSVISTVSSFRINTTSSLLGTPIPNSTFSGKTISWTTTYPPHYYSYKTSFQSSTYGFNSPTDTHNLNFKIKSVPVISSSAYVTLSSYITTDYNLLKYDLVNNTLKDYELVKFELTGDVSVLSKNVIQCYYGEDFNVSYPINVAGSIARGPWIPACSANNFLISYPNTPYGEVNLFLRPTLSSIAGVLAGETTHIILAEEQQQFSTGIPIFIQELSSAPNEFSVTAAMLSSSPNWPTRDLRDSFVTWSFYPSYLPVKIESIDSSGKVISTISPNQILKFSDSTSSVKFSNFGLASVTAVLSSQKYNEVATLSSTQGASQFNPFYLNTFSVGKVGLVDNIHKTRTVTLTARIPYGQTLYDIPIGTDISWVWGYENDFNYKRIPIKVYYGANRTPYVYGKILPATLLSSIYLEITPTTSETFPALESVKLEVRNLNNVPPIKTTYEFFLDQFPARKILNADFKIGYTYYQELSGTVLDTNKDEYVMTRPPDDTNYYTLTSNSNSDISPDTTYVWSLSDDFTGQQPLTSTIYANHLLSFIIHPKANTTIVTLCALSAVCPGWSDLPNIVENVDFQNTVSTLKHSVANSVTIHTPQDYYKDIVFNVLPEYFWNSSRYLTLTDQSNYSLALSPTAYEHKKSRSQNYYLSANKKFDEYDYYITSNTVFLSTLSSYYDLIELPYHLEFYSLTGLKISLKAYSDVYPSFLPSYFVKPTLRMGGYLQTLSYPTTAETVPYYNVGKGFQRAPYLTPYNSVSAITTFKVLTPIIDLSYSRKVTAFQSLSASPTNSPVQIYENEGSVTYLVSSNHWVANINVPATNGEFTLFNLKIGDPYEVGYVSNTELNKISFKPVQIEVPYYIPPSTFDNYNSTQWPAERDLWEKVNLLIPLSDRPWQTVTAYNTSIPLEVYVSWYMGVTGQEINLQFAGKGETEENNVVRYVVNFGESDNRIVIFEPNEPIKYTYLSEGSFYISYDAYYYDGSIKSGIVTEPVTVRNSWTPYSFDSIRTLQEDDLGINWPYGLDDILIQPNEWGDADIFNTAIGRLYSNFSYLLNNRNTINTDSPTIFQGWLGCHAQRKYQGVRWFVRNFGSTVEPKSVDFYQNVDSAINEGVSYFSDVKDVSQVGDYIFVIDNNLLRVFKDEGFKPSEIKFDNILDFSSEFISPSRLVVSSDNYAYVLDTPRNKVVAVGIDIENLGLNFSSSVGGFGKRDEPSRLNAPSDIELAEDSIYILDYGNRCVKEYNKDLSWLHTYYVFEFETNRPIYITAHYSGMVYVLTENLQIYVLDQLSNILKIIDISYININQNVTVKGMTFDEAGEFIYILTDSLIHKVSGIGDYIGTMTLGYSIKNESIHRGINRHLFISTKFAIVKVLDAVNVFGIGLGLPEEFWSLEQIQIKKQNMPSDLEYNKSLYRLYHNILNFRNNLNAKFVKVIEATSNGLITYYALKPVGPQERPRFSEDLENGSIGVGVNELHIPQVLNREFVKLYEALIQIKDFLSISNINLPNYKVEASGISIICPEEFCWSWKGTAGYNLTLPSIRICNVNPISFNELKTSFPVKYATTTNWLSAYGKCCVNQSPISR